MKKDHIPKWGYYIIGLFLIIPIGFILYSPIHTSNKKSELLDKQKIETQKRIDRETIKSNLELRAQAKKIWRRLESKEKKLRMKHSENFLRVSMYMLNQRQFI